MTQNLILTLSCPDTIGIVAAVTQFIAQHQGMIVCSNQHGEQSNQSFFMRVEIDPNSINVSLDAFRQRFAQIAEHYAMTWRLEDGRQKKRMLILTSKQSHCLTDLLHRYQSGDLHCDIVGVISNHPDTQDYVAWHQIPYHHIDMAGDQKSLGFQKITALIQALKPDVIVLARFMQIIPPELCQQYAGSMINIHHSFLPAFVGANPYAKAFSKGVKLVGATCHYVTEELDEGPIIEQDVVRIHHGHSEEDIKRLGKDVEKSVLARGVSLHLQDRIIIHGNKTVVF